MDGGFCWPFRPRCHGRAGGVVMLGLVELVTLTVAVYVGFRAFLEVSR